MSELVLSSGTVLEMHLIYDFPEDYSNQKHLINHEA